LAWTGGTGATAAESFTYTPSVGGAPQAPETIIWGASHPNTNAGLLAAIADWNSQSTLTQAYEADATGTPTVGGDYLAIQTRGGNEGAGAVINMTAIDTPTGNHLAVASTAGKDPSDIRCGTEHRAGTEHGELPILDAP
jgi:hypothetical protein